MGAFPFAVFVIVMGHFRNLFGNVNVVRRMMRTKNGVFKAISRNDLLWILGRGAGRLRRRSKQAHDVRNEVLGRLKRKTTEEARNKIGMV